LGSSRSMTPMPGKSMYRYVASSITSSMVTVPEAEEVSALWCQGWARNLYGRKRMRRRRCWSGLRHWGHHDITTPNDGEVANLHPRPPRLHRSGRPRPVAPRPLEGRSPLRPSVPPPWRRQGLVEEERPMPLPR
jgi:hypothetical protein